MKLCTAVFLGLLLACFSARAVDRDSTFRTANQAYASGDFVKAREGYEALVRQGDLAANVFFNLGNAAWRMADPGAAALNYERALTLQTNHPEAVDNLRLVREKSGAKVFVTPRWERFLPKLSARTFQLGAVIAGWIFVFALAAIGLRWQRGAALVIALLAALAGVCSGFGSWRMEQRERVSIVIARSVEARFAPLDNSPLVDTLPAASEVRVLQNGGAWAYCLLPNQTRAWIPAPSLAPLRPAGS